MGSVAEQANDLEIHYRYENPDTSYFYWSKAHEIYHDLQDEGNMMIAEFNIAILHLDVGRLSEKLPFIEALTLPPDMGLPLR